MVSPYEGFEPYESRPAVPDPLLDQIDHATLIAWFRCNSCYTCKWRTEVIDKDQERDIHWCARTHDRGYIVDMVRYLEWFAEIKRSGGD